MFLFCPCPAVMADEYNTDGSHQMQISTIVESGYVVRLPANITLHQSSENSGFTYTGTYTIGCQAMLSDKNYMI